MPHRIEIKTILLPADDGSQPGDVAIVSLFGSKVGLAVSARDEGDAEIWLETGECLELISALEEAIGQLKARGGDGSSEHEIP